MQNATTYIHKYCSTLFFTWKARWPVLLIFAAGVGIRLLLIAESWPHLNFDEGTIGEMALNIAYHGAHPIYFYGQNYMGALQAYIAATFFSLFGISLFSLRLGLVLFIALFLLCMYLLTTRLYPQKVALLTLIVLSLGANFVLYRELQAIGGYPDTLMFGSLAFVLATWLAQTASEKQPRLVRLLAYGSYGLVAGLGLWTDLLILPCLLCSGLLLLFFCWRDIRSLALPCLLLFLALGISPMLWYSLHHPTGQSALNTALTIFHGGQSSLQKTLPSSILSAVVIGLPTMTSYNPICPVSSTLFFGGSGHRALACTLTQGSWGLGVILLWCCSLFLTTRDLYLARARSTVPHEERQQALVRNGGRLALLASTACSFAIFAISPTAISSPYLNSRYLICILLGTPALLYPLGSAASAIRNWHGWRKGISVLSWTMLISLLSVFLFGTLQVLLDIPNAIAANTQQQDLARRLIQLRATHIYSDFFDCDRIIFMSQEKVACNVMDDTMHPTGSRFAAFGELVAHDPQPSYVFPPGNPQTALCEQRFRHNTSYQHLVLDGYEVYTPRVRSYLQPARASP